MLSEKLKTEIIEYLNTFTDTPNWKFEGQKIESTDCNVYRLSNPDYSKDIALKLYYPEKNQKISKHYAAIERFSKALNNPESKYRVPKPYGLFSSNNCFLMEWVTGETLKNKLWFSCLNKSELQTYIRDAYCWLSCFHQSADPILKRVDISSYLKKLELHNKSINSECMNLSNSTFYSGLKTLSKFSEQFKNHKTLHTDIHGDLNLSNIIVGSNQITGIDISASKSEPIENDIAQMLNYICVNYFNMLTRFDLRKPQHTWEIFNVVLDAYGYPKEQKSRDFFLFVFFYQMLYRWVSITKTHNSGKEKTMTFFLLGKWRKHNSSVIVNCLTKLINDKYL